MSQISLCYGCMNKYKAEYGICPFCGYKNTDFHPEPIHLLPGTRLQNKYIVGKAIGHGGFSVTYMGLDTVLDVRVAIKEYMPSEYATRTGNQSRMTVSMQGSAPQMYREGMHKFVEEAQRLAAMDDVEGIVKVFDAFVENNTAYIVMEYLEGETLAEKLKREVRLEPQKVFSMMMPLMDSLERIHKAGLLHRDISPDNIIVTSKNTVKLIDFGSARYITHDRSRSLSVFIKPGYTPAEQYSSDGRQGTWTDVYSLAATMYKMITGITPPDGFQRRAKDNLMTPGKVGVRMTRNAENAILNAMNTRIDSRTKTIGEFKQQLFSTREVRRLTDGKAETQTVLTRWAAVTVAMVALLTITMVILAASGVFQGEVSYTNGSYIMPADKTRVPSFHSHTLEDADQKAQKYYLRLQANDADFSADAPVDTILSQNPDPGKMVPKNSEVFVTVSAGPKKILMPWIRGMESSQAEKKLKDSGFRVEASHAESVYTKGHVCSEDLQPGVPYDDKTKITITISDGRTEDPTIKVRVPDFNQKQIAQAEEIADSGNVSISVRYQPDERYDNGTIISQSVKAGEKINRYGEIVLTVADNGMVLVPYVKGKSQTSAEEAIRSAGLTPTIEDTMYSDTVASGHVISQTPAGQQAVRRYTKVGLVVSLGIRPGTAAPHDNISPYLITPQQPAPITERREVESSKRTVSSPSSVPESSAGSSEQESSEEETQVEDESSQESSQQEHNAVIVGTVKDESSQPLHGVTVTLRTGKGESYNASTDASGNYTMHVTNGTTEDYTLYAELSGYESRKFDCKGTEKQTITHNITLKKTGEDADWQKLYGDFLKEKETNTSGGIDLYDFDEDGIPELIYSDGTSHVNSVNVYAVKDGKVTSLDVHGQYGVLCHNASQKILLGEGFINGYGERSYFYTYDKNGIKVLYKMESILNQKPNVFKVNDKTVTQSEYEAIKAKYINGSIDSDPAWNRYFGRGNLLSEVDVNTVLKNWKSS